ncbi:MAG: hypothetical protein Q9168_004725 [Polycauliona sp. 1 TL-2023]
MADTLNKSDVPIWTNPSPTSDVRPLTGDQGIKAAKDIAFGSLAGSIGKLIEYPFDTIKVRLQSQPHPPIYSGPLDCFRQSLLAPEGGLSSLYRGISAPILGAAIETSSLFFSYRIAQSALQAFIPSLPQGKGDSLPLTALLACGAISGATTSLLLTPIELVKCKLQYPVSSTTDRTSQSHKSRGPLSVIASVFRNHGILGFWRGQLGTLIRETGGSAAWFGSYEGVLIMLRDERLPHHDGGTESVIADQSRPPIHHQLLAGASAGVAYNFVFFPADTIKSRMQTEEPGISTANGKSQVQSTFWRSGAELWRQQGLRGLYRGCGITVARAAPSSAVIFAIYEGLSGWYR